MQVLCRSPYGISLHHFHRTLPRLKPLQKILFRTYVDQTGNTLVSPLRLLSDQNKVIVDRVNLLDKAIAELEERAAKNDKEAYIPLAELYFFGNSRKKVDQLRAKSFLSLAAFENDSKALNDIGVLYYKGCEGIQIDKPRAVSLFTQAAEHTTDPDANANLFLAILYLTGVDVEKDVNKGNHYLNRAISLGNPLAEAANKLVKWGVMTEYNRLLTSLKELHKQGISFAKPIEKTVESKITEPYCLMNIKPLTVQE